MVTPVQGCSWSRPGVLTGVIFPRCPCSVCETTLPSNRPHSCLPRVLAHLAYLPPSAPRGSQRLDGGLCGGTAGQSSTSISSTLKRPGLSVEGSSTEVGKWNVHAGRDLRAAGTHLWASDRGGLNRWVCRELGPLSLNLRVPRAARQLLVFACAFWVLEGLTPQISDIGTSPVLRVKRQLVWQTPGFSGGPGGRAAQGWHLRRPWASGHQAHAMLMDCCSPRRGRIGEMSVED